MNSEMKDVTIGEKAFSVVKLDPWRRLTFVADLQKDFLMPLLKNSGEKDFTSLFSSENGSMDAMAIMSSFSSAIDGKTLEKWTKRILSDGLVIYSREDGQKAKFAFSEINKFFTNPADIILLLKEAIVFNLEGMGDLIKSVTPNGGAAKARITEQ